jgi:hypothetical protein
VRDVRRPVLPDKPNGPYGKQRSGALRGLSMPEGEDANKGEKKILLRTRRRQMTDELIRNVKLPLSEIQS